MISLLGWKVLFQKNIYDCISMNKTFSVDYSKDKNKDIGTLNRVNIIVIDKCGQMKNILAYSEDLTFFKNEK